MFLALAFMLSAVGFSMPPIENVSAFAPKASVEQQIDPNFNPDTPVIEDITLEALAASGLELPVAENVAEEILNSFVTRAAPTYYASSSDVGWKKEGAYWYYYDSNNE